MCNAVCNVLSILTLAAIKNEPHLYNPDPNLVCRCIIIQQLLQLQGFIYNEIDFVSQLASTDCKMMLRDVWEKLNTTGFKFEP